MLSDLLRRRVVFVLGKGGSGNTSVSAALALAASESGHDLLAMECETRAPMAAILGVKASFEPEMVSERLFTMVLEGRHALEEYLRLVVPAHTVLRTVFASRLYQFFVQAAPGLKELMMLGKIYYEAERKLGDGNHWDLIVVDAPASGQALSLLRMPGAARETFRESVVGKESGKINRLIRDPQVTAVVIVTTPEPLPIAETLETAAALREMGITPAAIIFNRGRSPQFTSRDVAKLKEHLIGAGQPADAEHLGRIAKAELDRAAQAEHALRQLQAEIDAPLIQVTQFHGLAGKAMVRALAQELENNGEEKPNRRASIRG